MSWKKSLNPVRIEHPPPEKISSSTGKANAAENREGICWRLEPPKNSNKSPLYQTVSDEREMKRKVVEERGGGGGSEPSDLGAKMREKRETKGKNKRERATRRRSDHLWSQSPSPGGERRSRSLKPC